MHKQLLLLGCDVDTAVIGACANRCVDSYSDTTKNHAYTSFDGLRGTHVKVLQQHDTLYVAVRGTKKMRDWLYNILVRKVKFDKDGSRVHRGFNARCLGVWQELTAYIFEEIRNVGVTKVVFTGHSLGAAVATLMYSYFTSYKYSAIKSVTVSLVCFASPNVGNPKFAARFQNDPNCVMFRDNDDIVTWIPVINFRRICVPLIHFDSSGKAHDNPSTMFYLKDLARGVWDAVRSGNLNPVQDHDMKKYHKLVWQAISKQ